MQYISILPRALPSGVMLIYCIQTSGVVNNYYIYIYTYIMTCNFESDEAARLTIFLMVLVIQ